MQQSPDAPPPFPTRDSELRALLHSIAPCPWPCLPQHRIRRGKRGAFAPKLENVPLSAGNVMGVPHGAALGRALAPRALPAAVIGASRSGGAGHGGVVLQFEFRDGWSGGCRGCAVAAAARGVVECRDGMVLSGRLALARPLARPLGPERVAPRGASACSSPPRHWRTRGPPLECPLTVHCR